MSGIPTNDSGRIGGRRRSAGGWTRIGAHAAGWSAVVVVAAAVGAAAVGNLPLGLALAALVLLLGVFVADPVLLAVIVLPGALLVQRIGGASANLSLADLLVFLGGLVCLFLVRWKDAPFLRQFLMGIVWYQAVLILVVVAHPYRFNIVEWFHRFSYLAASVLVGWVIATHGRTRQALRLFLWGSAVLALVAMEHAVTLHFQPAQWGVYQKNTIGSIMWVAIVVAQINPPWAGISRHEARIPKYLCIGGLLASQSRQSIILLIIAISAAVLLNPEVRGRSKLVLAGAVPLVILLYYSFAIGAHNNPKFNSVSIRFGQIGAAVHVWHLSPILGEGMRFYNLPQFVSVTAPPNVLVDNLASTGVVGSIAFLFLVFITVRTMFRLPVAYGTLGLVILMSHYVGGLFDTFWIGASTIAPFIIAGISLGMADLHRGTAIASGLRGNPAVRATPSGRNSVREQARLRTPRRAGRPAGFGQWRDISRTLPTP
ncbi:MAG TPA: O-antigen ligase family protein [Acidimicrobiales bacterium]|nr:O-antigen ligase family protein [Acidimicrobiales bacterium]